MALDLELIRKCQPAILRGEPVHFTQQVRNVNRSVGVMLSGEVVRHNPMGLPDGTIHLELEGTGGQSFSGFLASGMTFDLIGDANDFVGKGLSGGRIIVRPPLALRSPSEQNIIVGNTVLYGATSGEAYFRGVAGERFAVRLSGASTVVEGVGDHGCEYMTGGTVAVLGRTGRNFAAGMSGGVAYVYDEDSRFAERCNPSMVALQLVLPASEQLRTVPAQALHQGQADETLLRTLIEQHRQLTGSPRAAELLADWDTARQRFVKVMPHEYARALSEHPAGTATSSETPAPAGSVQSADTVSMQTGPAEHGGQGTLVK
nr:hypothetical protein [Deinococcus sp. Marseille-Q6407]